MNFFVDMKLPVWYSATIYSRLMLKTDLKYNPYFSYF